MTSYAQEVVLPSNGYLYDGKIPDGRVLVEPMGTKEEKLIAAGSGGPAIIKRIFDACVQCPIPHEELVLGDRLFLLLKIREVTYGDEYRISFRCDECGAKNSAVIKLSELEVKRATASTTSSFSVTLPLTNREIKLRLLTGRDEEKVAQYVSGLKKRTTHGAAEQAEYIYRLARRIDEIDGQAIGVSEAIQFIEELKGRDSIAMRDAINDNDVGPLLEAAPVCEQCEYQSDTTPLAITAEFFRPRRHRSGDYDYIGAAEALDAADKRNVG